jgi:hypothetical protein
VDELGPAIVGALATAVLHGLVFWALRRFAPAGERPADLPPREELQRRCAKWVFVELAVLAVCVPLCAAAWFFGLSALANRPRGVDIMLQQVPDWPMWALPALFFGLLTAALPDALVLRALLGAERLREYVRYQEDLYGFDSRRSTVLLATPVLLFFIPYVAVCLDTYSYFDREGLVVNEAFSLREVRRPYSAITAVQKGMDAEVGTALGYEVVFADGYTWRPHGLGPPLDDEEEAAIVQLVCERSGRTVQVVQHR